MLCTFLYKKMLFLGIRAGKSVEVVFNLEADGISSILRDAYHKFLDGFYTFPFSASSIA